MADFLTRRDGIWHFVRRVPLEFAWLDRRGVVRHSTKVRVADDPKAVKAGPIARRMNGELEAYWRGLVEGRAAEAHRRYAAARKRARAFGFDYAPAAEIVAERDILEILQRFEALVSHRAVEEETEVAAVLGGESPPEILLSGLFDEYERSERASLSDLSPDQLRKWRNPKLRAIANLTGVIGDKSIARVTRGDTLDFREWWAARVVSGEVEIATANKDFGHLNRMFKVVDKRHRLGLGPVFADLRIEDETTRVRAAFDVKFVQERILKDGALDGLNPAARAIVYIMAETGLRVTEAANLGEDTIVLSGEVPHVRVRGDGRRLKTRQSERDVPLVGVALMAATAFPKGFPRYRDRSSTLSAAVNKFMRERGLLPSEAHTLYSLRHTFKDRLRAVEAPEEMVDALMGHKTDKPSYGAGHALAHKLRWLQRIALTPPAEV